MMYEEKNEALNSDTNDVEDDTLGVDEAVSELEEVEAESTTEIEKASDPESKPDISSASLINQVEALVFSSAVPISAEKIVKQLEALKPPIGEVRSCLVTLQSHYENRGVHLAEVATGWRFQVALDCAPTIVKTLEEKPTRLSRALLETLALIAYRQPITRGEIEAIRGVVVSSHMVRTLLEHEWIRVVGHKDVPGKPALLATTKTFLDDMGLSKLEELPPLSELKALAPESEEVSPAEAEKEAAQETEAEASNASSEASEAIDEPQAGETTSIKADETNLETESSTEESITTEAVVDLDIEADTEMKAEVDVRPDTETDSEIEVTTEATDNMNEPAAEKNMDIRSALAALRESAEPIVHEDEQQEALNQQDESIETDSFNHLDDFSEIILTKPTTKTDEVVDKDDNAEDEQNNQESSA